jgi:asparagine synthase (glutamine-hydrolysing)
MCGVAGCLNQPDGGRVALAMLDHLHHRGPDARGLVDLLDTGHAVQLAHTRLSIIDLTAAADQPFRRGRFTLVYNGELYNFRELRRELSAGGSTFTTSSDTEVLMEAWARWGADALSRLRGMFAFAVHDADTGELTLARDHLGIKPLYVLRRGGGIVFSSELQAIVTALGPELRVNATALVASALYYWIPEQHSAIERVHKVAPGTLERYRPDGTVTARRYWSAADASAAAAAAGEVDRPDLRAVLDGSVAAHLVADVPVATFLSGGLDSSIITALAHRADPSLESYTITVRGADQRLEAMPDDARYARALAASLGIRLHEIELDPDVSALLPRMIRALDEPIGDPAAINTLLMCEAARASGVKVLLSGMGADELFGGYRKHLACLLAARYRRLPRRLRHRVVEPLVDAAPLASNGRGLRYVRWAKRFTTFADLDEEAAFRRSYTLYDPEELAALLTPDAAGDVQTLVDEHAATYHDCDLNDPVNRMCLADSRLFLPGLNLAYTDRASMAASTEVRVPFVDVEVFRAAFALPGSAKIRGRTQKAALKQAAEAWLPREVIHRPKASFGAPLRAWVSNDLRETIDDLLVGGRLADTGFLDKRELQRLVEDQQRGRRDESKQLWQLLTLEMWYRDMRDRGVSGL